MCGGWCFCHDSRQCRSAVLHLGMFKDRLTAVIRKPILASPTHHYSGPDCPDTHRWKAPPAGGAVPPKALRLPILSRNRRHLLLHCSLLRPQVTNFALVTRRKQAKHPASSITSVCQPWHGRASSSHSLAASSRSCSQHTVPSQNLPPDFVHQAPAAPLRKGPTVDGAMSDSTTTTRPAASLLLLSDLELPSLSVQGPNRSREESSELFVRKPGLYFERLPPASHNEHTFLHLSPGVRRTSGRKLGSLIRVLRFGPRFRSFCLHQALLGSRCSSVFGPVPPVPGSTRRHTEASDYRAVAVLAVVSRLVQYHNGFSWCSRLSLSRSLSQSAFTFACRCFVPAVRLSIPESSLLAGLGFVGAIH